MVSLAPSRVINSSGQALPTSNYSGSNVNQSIQAGEPIYPRASPWEMTKSNFGAGLGQGFGEGISGAIQGHIRQGILEKALGKLNPNASPMDRFLQLAQIDPELAKAYAPNLREEGKQQAVSERRRTGGEAYSQALNQIRGTQGNQPKEPINTENLSEEQINKLVDYQNKEREFELNSNKVALAETKDFRKHIDADYKNFLETGNNLDEMQALNESGKLNSPLFAKGMEKMGTEFLLTPESQEYNKRVSQFLQGIKQIFGSQISGFEVNQFLKGIPTLQNSEEGRRRIIKNMKLVNQAKEVYFKAYEDVLAENGDKVPIDLEKKVLKKAAPQIKTLGKELKDDLDRVKMTLPNGKNVTFARKDVEAAKKLGAVER